MTNLGEILTLWSVIPFAGMLLSIALFPLFAPRFWHHHFGAVTVFWSVLLAVPFLSVFRSAALHELLHAVIADYVPFIVLLGSLYTISGGIMIRGRVCGTPPMNTALLATGTLLASWIGTTGSAMLLIRPFLRGNAHRKDRTFMIVFFIFLVANTGGALTPLGDPPLFLGFIRGVPFFWTLRLLPHMAIISGILLGVYFVVDAYYHKREDSRALRECVDERLGMSGGFNLFLLLGVVGAVLMSGIANWGELSILGVHRGVQDVVRDVLLLVMSTLSLLLTPKSVREYNEFTWFPIKEVAILFAGVFLTMVPCLKILQAGERGDLAALVVAVKDPYHYFWVTGLLSSFLDNAPTYTTFLNSAIGNFYPGVPVQEAVPLIIRERPLYLEAISAGAVFFGALTYIGNAPNFLIRSIAEEAGVPMPGFFGYMIKYSLVILVPVFLVITVIFF